MPQLILFLMVLALIFSVIPYIAAILALIIVSMIIYKIISNIYVERYFKSDQFKMIKEQIKENAKQCNDLNLHIEDLKKTYVEIKSPDNGKANYYDSSNYNFKRPNISKMVNDSYTYNCSLSICKNAKMQPFKYLCKYFNIPINESTLEKFEIVFNNFSAVEQGKVLLKKERDNILNSVNSNIPQFIYKNYKERLLRELGFSKIDFSEIYFPKYSFVYVSPAGNSSMRCDISLNTYNLESFIKYLADLIEFKKSAAGQRALMTSNLREQIKKRDNYTCQNCGLSTKDEPNLLLEIDHIIPISKGGITTEDNLQTLCWRCNRAKSNKIIENNNISDINMSNKNE